MTEKGSNAVDIPGWHLLIIVTLLVLGPVIAFMVSGNGGSDSSSASDSNSKTAISYPAQGASKYYYVQDYSGVFSHATEKYIFTEAMRLFKQTSAPIVVIAVPNTGSESVGAYSRKTANRLHIGSRDKNGILILFTTDDPHVSLQVGRGLVNDIPDARARQIIDEYAVADKNSRHWNKAAMNTFTATAEILYRKYGKDVPDTLAFVKDVPEGLQGHTFGDMKLPEPGSDAPDEYDDFFRRITWAAVAFIIIGFGVFFIYFIIRDLQGDIVHGGDGGSDSGGDWGGGGSDGGGFGGGGASD